MNVKKYFVLGILSLAVTVTVSCGKSSNNTDTKNVLTVYAAAGTRLATDAVCDLFEKNNNYTVERNYASSGTLARQLASGAACDVYVSANRQWIDFLEKKGILVKGSVEIIAGNSLVIITPLDSDLKEPDFTGEYNIASKTPGKIAIGDPGYVPVGKYTKDFFVKLGWFETLKNKTVMAKDVSAVLHYVELGECDWGVVYYTEALKSKKVKILARVPSELHKPITFYVADIKDRKKTGHDLLKAFINKSGQDIFQQHGFSIIR